MINSKVPASPVYSQRNNLGLPGRLCFEHYQRVAGAHYVADAYGDLIKEAVGAESGDDPLVASPAGGTDLIEVVPQSNCGADTYLEILNVRVWAAAGVSKTYRFYVQSTYVTLPSAELKLYGEYLDEGSGGHLATVSSTQDITTRSNQNDWSQYVEVAINPAQDGWVNLYLRLMGYESGKKVWVDPKLDGYKPKWSYGEVTLEMALLDEVLEGTMTVAEALRIMLAALGGKSSGGGTSTLKFRDKADGKDRITATVDASGDRTAVTLDGS